MVFGRLFQRRDNEDVEAVAIRPHQSVSPNSVSTASADDFVPAKSEKNDEAFYSDDAYGETEFFPMDQDEFDHRFGYNKPTHKHNTFVRKAAIVARHFGGPCTTGDRFLQTLVSFLPIVTWLPQYNFRTDFVKDALGGLTLGVMHVPQGIAYAALAHVNPITGLYTSFFPPIVYMFLATSQHNSIGTYSVAAMITGSATLRHCRLDDDAVMNGTVSDGKILIDEDCAMLVASTMAFTVGVVHLLMGVLKLELIMHYFSDALVSGFMTAATLQIIMAQCPPLFGVHFKAVEGFGNFFRNLGALFSELPNANWITTVLGILSMAFLYVGKEYVSPVVQRKLRIPIGLPLELILIIITTLVSYLVQLKEKHGVEIIDHIPTGLPMPQIPDFGKMPDLFMEALTIAVLVMAMHLSMAKIYAKKGGYRVHDGQELYALGFASVVSGFFPVYPVSTSLGRTALIYEAGSKSQLVTITSSLFVAANFIYAGRWLEPLPLCVLAATLIVALKSMLLKGLDLPRLWPLNKVDFCVWLVSFIATLCWDLKMGLLISVVFALLTIILRTQFPRWRILVPLKRPDDYRDCERYTQTTPLKGLCIFRFDAPLMFTNADKFKTAVMQFADGWRDEPMVPVFPEEVGKPHVLDRLNAHITTHSDKVAVAVDQPLAGLFFRHVVIDCSSMSFADTEGANAMRDVFLEMQKYRVLVYFAAAKAPVREQFETCGHYTVVPKSNFYPTVRDAVELARKRRSTATGHLIRQLGLQSVASVTQASHLGLHELYTPPSSPVKAVSEMWVEK